MTRSGSGYVDIDRFIETFLRARRSPRTSSTYKQQLSKFRRWADRRGLDLLDVEAVDLKRYFDEQLDDGLAESTIATQQAAISSFYNYAAAEGVIAASPMRAVDRMKKNREPEPSGLGREELAAIVLAASENPSAPESAIVLLIALNGLKANEVASLQIGDISRNKPYWSVRVPGRKQGTEDPLPPAISERLALVIGDRRRGPVFLNTLGEQIDRHYIRRVVARTGQRAGLETDLSPARLRTTMIGVALDSGSSPARVAESVGVEDLRALTKLIPASANQQHPALRLATILSEPQVSDDLLHQVEALLADETVHPSAPIVVTGAVLESRLRSLAQRVGAIVPGVPSLAKFIEALRRADAITPLEWRELQLWAELRNQAAHGDGLETLTRTMARRMLDGVSTFLQAHR